MATKGQEAKTIFAQKLQEIFGSDFVGEVDKKLYVWVQESSGERVQLALAVTCPKNAIVVADAETAKEVSVEITKEEIEAVKELFNEFGI